MMTVVIMTIVCLHPTFNDNNPWSKLQTSFEFQEFHLLQFTIARGFQASKIYMYITIKVKPRGLKKLLRNKTNNFLRVYICIHINTTSEQKFKRNFLYLAEDLLESESSQQLLHYLLDLIDSILLNQIAPIMWYFIPLSQHYFQPRHGWWDLNNTSKAVWYRSTVSSFFHGNNTECIYFHCDREILMDEIFSPIEVDFLTCPATMVKTLPRFFFPDSFYFFRLLILLLLEENKKNGDGNPWGS